MDADWLKKKKKEEAAILLPVLFNYFRVNNAK